MREGGISATDNVIYGTAHTVSQRLRMRIKTIPAELWPLGKLTPSYCTYGCHPGSSADKGGGLFD